MGQFFHEESEPETKNEFVWEENKKKNEIKGKK